MLYSSLKPSIIWGIRITRNGVFQHAASKHRKVSLSMSPVKYTPEERIEAFWAKVDKSGGDNACWLWTASCHVFGYGAFGWGSRTNGAHRISWMLAYGEIPDGLEVCHNCPDGDNPRCVNPAHLWLGTHQQNVEDMRKKGRARLGDRHHNVKLSEEDVTSIRLRYTQGNITQRELARQYGIRQQHVSSILTGRRWKKSYLDQERR